jgi:predicted RNA methylase
MNLDLFPEPRLTVEIPEGGRDPLDRFYSPEPAVRILTCHLRRRLKGARVWEPCAGGGVIVREVGRWAESVYSTDLDPDAVADETGVDFLSTSPDSVPPFDWIISNPPYSTARGLASDFVRHALQMCGRVAMLLRISFLEACRDREDILNDYRLTDLLVLKRVSFGGPAGRLVGSADTVPSAWFVWDEYAPHQGLYLESFSEPMK